MEEVWKSIKDYEGLYEVSNWGRVRNARTGKVLRPGKNTKGYLFVVLCNGGVLKHYRVHRLVAQAFLPNPYNLPQVNHKDQDKTNNRMENLEWCDGFYNQTYSNGKTVYQYTLDDELVKVWPSAKECGRHGFDHSSIVRCCNGKLKKHKGFKWSYGSICT